MKATLLILGVLIGAMAMYFAYPEINPSASETSDAKVQDVNGVYVYIMAQPKSDFEVIGLLSEKNIVEMGQDIGNTLSDKSKNFFQRIGDAIGQLKQDINFRERLELYVESAKTKNSDVKGLIFSRSDLKEATMIKF
jgi:hypothetical protein